MAFDPIRAGDTDAFQFDLTAWFPSGVGSAAIVSQPAGWTFSGKTTVGSVVTVYGMAPATCGYFTLSCTGSDGVRTLTKEERILVVP